MKITRKVTVEERIDNRIERAIAQDKADLILDNFGTFLAGLIRAPPPAIADKDITLRDTTNTNRTIRIYSGAGTNIFNYSLGGTRVGVGSSSQAAARTDVNLISQLGSLADTDTGVWTSATGRVTFTGSVLLVAGGTVREVGFFAYWRDTGAVSRTFMLFRDVISDVVIAAGKYAFVQYEIQL